MRIILSTLIISRCSKSLYWGSLLSKVSIQVKLNFSIFPSMFQKLFLTLTKIVSFFLTIALSSSSYLPKSVVLWREHEGYHDIEIEDGRKSFWWWEGFEDEKRTIIIFLWVSKPVCEEFKGLVYVSELG